MDTVSESPENRPQTEHCLNDYLDKKSLVINKLEDGVDKVDRGIRKGACALLQPIVVSFELNVLANTAGYLQNSA